MQLLLKTGVLSYRPDLVLPTAGNFPRWNHFNFAAGLLADIRLCYQDSLPGSLPPPPPMVKRS